MEPLILGAANNNNMITLSYHQFDINLMNEVLNNGLLDKFLISKGVIPYNFNFNENVYVTNPTMIIDLRENNFQYINYDFRETVSNAVSQNIHNNDKFHVVVVRSVNIQDNFNLDNLGETVANIINSI
jgi:hypothetical protein